VTGLTELQKFTAEELEEYNGKNGKVYDASGSDLWRDGEHMGLHEAGKDITEELEIAPHREEVLERVKLVGTLE